MSNATNPLDIIKTRQRAWALRAGRTLDGDGYCASADDNTFPRLSDAAREDFVRGDGTELGKLGERGKIQAVHSSSAMTCNWFDYWRERDLTPLARAFGVSLQFRTLALEKKFSTGLNGRGPNLDVVLTAVDGALFAIESKFTEVYVKAATKTFLKPKYFPDGRSLWADVGLPGCQVLAESLRAGSHPFAVLDVAQLLKHMLALARSGHPWSVLCLWYEMPGPVAQQHRAELDDFGASIGNDAAHFSALTYQELFARMVPVVGPEHADYMGYLRDRYLGEGAAS
jgi:hypothetical protein